MHLFFIYWRCGPSLTTWACTHTYMLTHDCPMMIIYSLADFAQYQIPSPNSFVYTVSITTTLCIGSLSPGCALHSSLQATQEQRLWPCSCGSMPCYQMHLPGRWPGITFARVTVQNPLINDKSRFFYVNQCIWSVCGGAHASMGALHEKM